MKSSRFDVRNTCDTDDSDQLEIRQSQLMTTRVLRLGLEPGFRSQETMEKIRRLRETGICDQFDKALSALKDIDPFQHLIEEIKADEEEEQEEFSHHWLPDSCFIHPVCMDYPTPKRAFSPNKPRHLKFIT